MICNAMTAGILAVGSLFAGAAQAAASPLLAQVKITQTSGKTYILEAIITVALMGGALFVVCRTSRRS